MIPTQEQKQCISAIYARPDGLQNLILQTVQSSWLRRLNLPIPLNTLQISSQTQALYLETLYHLKQLELAGKVQRTDYYPNPFALFVILFPTPSLKIEWLRHCQTRMLDPTAGAIYFEGEEDDEQPLAALRPRTPNNFALWTQQNAD